MALALACLAGGPSALPMPLVLARDRLAVTHRTVGEMLVLPLQDPMSLMPNLALSQV